MSPTDDPGGPPQDRPLDDCLARSLITSRFPELRPARITGRYGGVDHHAVEIDSAWIFRFPKRAECQPMLLRELKLLPEVEPLVPVPVPRYQFVGNATTEYPWTFAGYRKLAGMPAIACPPGRIDLAELAAVLGRILSVLHRCDPEEFARLGVVRLDEFEDLASIRAGTLEELEPVRSELPHDLYERLREYLIYQDPNGAAEPSRSVLLHGDLGAEHLLIGDDGRLVGLIDWADACLGDPAYDLKFLWVWQGEDFVRRVLDHYSGNVDPGFLGRVRFHGICTAVDEVAYGLSARRDENLRLGLAALGRAFADGRTTG